MDDAARQGDPRVVHVDDIGIGNVATRLARRIDRCEGRLEALVRAVGDARAGGPACAQEELVVRPVDVRLEAVAELLRDGGEGVLLRRVEPVRAAIEGQSECRPIRIGAPADAVVRFQHDDRLAGALQRQPRGKACSARTDDSDVVVGHGFVTRRSVRLMRPPSFSRVEVPESTRSMP